MSNHTITTASRPAPRPARRGFMRAALLATALGLGAVPAFAQEAAAPAPVLKGAQVTEASLIDALAIEPPESAAGVTRGFRPMAGAAGKSEARAKPGAGKANLLITFGTQSSEIGAETRAVLDTLARALQSDNLAGFGFKVEGHADARGDAERNLRLSQLRAEAVMAYLVEKHGILAARLRAIGKGSSEPLNKTRVNAPENRRVTIVTMRD